MIFKQVDEILSGTKTQTRRVCKTGESQNIWKLDDEGASVINEVVSLHPKPDKYGLRVYSKWVVGRTYAVAPKRGQPAVWWREKNGPIELLHEHPGWPALRQLNTSRGTWRYVMEDMRSIGYRPLCIRITAIRREDVRAISDEDVKAEGFPSRIAFLEQWVGMHDSNAAFCEDPKTPGVFVQWRGRKQNWVHGSASDVLAYLDSRPADRYQAWALAFEVVK